MSISPVPPSYAMSVAAPAVKLTKAQKLQAYCQGCGINPTVAQSLQQLTKYDIVFICDDSGSMDSPMSPGSQRTRWNELCADMFTQVALATCLDEDGPDIYFLNRPKICNVKTIEDVTAAFANGPDGRTPMGARIKQVIEEKYTGGNLLIMIATDGSPSDMSHKDFFNLIKTRNAHHHHEIKQRQENIRIEFIACAEGEEVKFLEQMDDDIPGVDTTETFASELKRAQKKNQELNRATWIAKAMLGAVDDSYDKLD